ncbi:MAG: hypothetical protein R3F56_26400 [Planctomycetota bacterium]
MRTWLSVVALAAIAPVPVAHAPRVATAVPILLPAGTTTPTELTIACTTQGGEALPTACVRLAPDLWLATPTCRPGATLLWSIEVATPGAGEPTRKTLRGELPWVTVQHPRGLGPMPQLSAIDLRQAPELAPPRPGLPTATEVVTYVFREPACVAGSVDFVESWTHWLGGSGPNANALQPVGDGRWIGQGTCMAGDTELLAALRLHLRDGRWVDAKGDPCATADQAARRDEPSAYARQFQALQRDRAPVHVVARVPL